MYNGRAYRNKFDVAKLSRARRGGLAVISFGYGDREKEKERKREEEGKEKERERAASGLDQFLLLIGRANRNSSITTRFTSASTGAKPEVSACNRSELKGSR